MPEASTWIARLRQAWLSWRDRRALSITTELDQKPATAFWLHVRAFFSLIRHIISR
jgi:hypothetical protein